MFFIPYDFDSSPNHICFEFYLAFGWGGYFEAFTLWPRGLVAANKTLPYFYCGSVASWPQRLFCRKYFDLVEYLNKRGY